MKTQWKTHGHIMPQAGQGTLNHDPAAGHFWSGCPIASKHANQLILFDFQPISPAMETGA